MPDNPDHRFADARLTQRGVHLRIVIGHRDYSVVEAARLCGLPTNTLRGRLRAGWDVVEAMTKPPVPSIPPHGRRPTD
jgi:hypothetical protein